MMFSFYGWEYPVLLLISIGHDPQTRPLPSFISFALGHALLSECRFQGQLRGLARGAGARLLLAEAELARD